MSGRFVKKKRRKPTTYKTGFLNEMETSSLRRGFDEECIKLNRHVDLPSDRFLMNRLELVRYLKSIGKSR